MHCVVFVTAINKEEAKRISDSLLDGKAAACVNMVDGIESFFWWGGKKDAAKETLLIIKTTKDLVDKVVTIVKDVHSYDTPEVIALPIIDGNPDYLKWIDSSLS